MHGKRGKSVTGAGGRIPSLKLEDKVSSAGNAKGLPDIWERAAERRAVEETTEEGKTGEEGSERVGVGRHE